MCFSCLSSECLMDPPLPRKMSWSPYMWVTLFLYASDGFSPHGIMCPWYLPRRVSLSLNSNGKFHPLQADHSNEGVTSIASRSLQAKGRILHSAAKSPFCCEMISQPFCTVLWFPPVVSRYDGSRIPQVERPLRSIAKSAVCYEVIS